jgi:hypothetical protein
VLKEELQTLLIGLPALISVASNTFTHGPPSPS